MTDNRYEVTENSDGTEKIDGAESEPDTEYTPDAETVSDSEKVPDAEKAPDTDNAPDADYAPDVQETLDALRRENESLRAAADAAAEALCAASEAANERAEREYAELYELFPGADIRSMPDSYRAALAAGVPPAAAYALEIRRTEVRAARAAAADAKARASSAGRLGNNSEIILSPAEVRAMSHEEVKANFALITKSMSHWSTSPGETKK